MYEPFLAADDSAVIERDFSMNLNCESFRQTQNQFMQSHNVCLHSEIVRWRGKKWYLYTLCDITQHPPEIVQEALVEAVGVVEKECNTKLRHLLIKSDNCSSQY